jgi:alkylation response protein AidB-like acyl-CoA dehydrogenase
MALILTEEQMMVRDNARAFLADKAPVAHLRHVRDTRDADGFSRPLWKAFAEMGFCGLLLPESLGGSGLGYVEGGVIMEEIGRNLTPSPFMSIRRLSARPRCCATAMAPATRNCCRSLPPETCC